MNLSQCKEQINNTLSDLFNEYTKEVPETLGKAMAYSVLNGGKRARSSMMLYFAERLNGDLSMVAQYGCAVEMIHAYSLIHDDLPAMDNDTLRRGVPTNHVVFGETQAILAGDGLLTMAFEVMSNAAISAQSTKAGIKALNQIAWAAGPKGMVGGQSLDIICERSSTGGENELKAIHLGKTARMFQGPLAAACILSGADSNTVNIVSEFGLLFGLIFQTSDDIMDYVSTPEEMGKSQGKDEASGKLSAVSLYGIEKAIQYEKQLIDKAILLLNKLPFETDELKQLILSQTERRS